MLMLSTWLQIHCAHFSIQLSMKSTVWPWPFICIHFTCSKKAQWNTQVTEKSFFVSALFCFVRSPLFLWCIMSSMFEILAADLLRLSDAWCSAVGVQVEFFHWKPLPAAGNDADDVENKPKQWRCGPRNRNLELKDAKSFCVISFSFSF